MEPITPETALELYLKDKKQESSDSTIRSHRSRLGHFLEWCEANEFVDEGIASRMIIPGATPEEQVRHDAIDPDRAREIVDYLKKFEYASRRHIVFHLLWNTGMRLGAIRALDTSDFNRTENPDGTVSHNLMVRHRAVSDTPLKLDEGSERNVTLTDEDLVEALRDWIKQNRPSVEDNYGRKPLIATEEGRASKSTIRSDIYTVVQPCYYREECPHGKEIEECEHRSYNQRSKCPSSTYPHSIRSGAVTEHLNEDIPETAVSGRANVSQRVLEQHYDRRTQREKMEQRRQYLDQL